MRGATAERVAVEIRAEGRVGTICLREPCALCGRDFDVQNGESRLVARDHKGNRLGGVCPRCALTGEHALREQLRSRAGRLRQKADELEGWAGAEIQVHPPARDSTSGKAAHGGTL